MDKPAEPSIKTMLLFGIGSLGTGIYLTVPSVLLLYYLTDVLAISAALAGLAVFLPRAYDIVLDPIMGWVSDRTRSRWGRRRPYLLAGALGTAITFVFLFNSPDLGSDRATFWYIVIIYALSATAYTVFAVPYLSMPAEMSLDPHVRTTIMSYRMGFAMSGILIGAAIAPWLVDEFGGGREGFAAMSWLIGLGCAVAMLVAFVGTRRAPVVVTAGANEPVLSAFAQLVRNRAFARLGAAYAIQLSGFGCFNAAAPYFVIHVMQRTEADIAVLFACVLGGSIISMPAWSALSARVGKVRAYGVAVVVVAVGTGGLWLAASPSAWSLAIVMATVMGLGFGGAQLLPFSILSDVIHDTGGSAAGAYTGAWTAIEKAGLAVGPLIVGAMLYLSHFVEGAGAAMQSEQALNGVRISIALVPAMLVAASLPILGLRSTR